MCTMNYLKFYHALLPFATDVYGNMCNLLFFFPLWKANFFTEVEVVLAVSQNEARISSYFCLFFYVVLNCVFCNKEIGDFMASPN